MAVIVERRVLVGERGTRQFTAIYEGFPRQERDDTASLLAYLDRGATDSHLGLGAGTRLVREPATSLG
jgi:hypothetical protein